MTYFSNLVSLLTNFRKKSPDLFVVSLPQFALHLQTLILNLGVIV